MATEPCQFVGRAGLKLQTGLNAFGIDPAGSVCADFGANVGGFTDCLLQRGAARVYAVDTGYGALAWRLRKRERVVVMERTNALHCDVPEPVDLVAIDVGWTPQELIVPAAARWLKPPGADGRIGIVSLLKPHYEQAQAQRRRPHAALDDAEAEAICQSVCRRLGEMGWPVRASVPSGLRGKGGNLEYVLWLDAIGRGSAGDGDGERGCPKTNLLTL